MDQRIACLAIAGSLGYVLADLSESVVGRKKLVEKNEIECTLYVHADDGRTALIVLERVTAVYLNCEALYVYDALAADDDDYYDNRYVRVKRFDFRTFETRSVRFLEQKTVRLLFTTLAAERAVTQYRVTLAAVEGQSILHVANALLADGLLTSSANDDYARSAKKNSQALGRKRVRR